MCVRVCVCAVEKGCKQYPRKKGSQGEGLTPCWEGIFLYGGPVSLSPFLLFSQETPRMAGWDLIRDLHAPWRRANNWVYTPHHYSLATPHPQLKGKVKYISWFLERSIECELAALEILNINLSSALINGIVFRVSIPGAYIFQILSLKRCITFNSVDHFTRTIVESVCFRHLQNLLCDFALCTVCLPSRFPNYLLSTTLYSHTD